MSNVKRASITVTASGPYIVEGITKVVKVTGDSLPLESDAQLCRCGYSKNKPLCDGAHGPYQFAKAAQLNVLPEPTRTYGDVVQVHYNPTVCAHLGVCTRNLPEVFNTTNRPWIEPDNADKATMVETIRQCPSGALTHTDTSVTEQTQGSDVDEPSIRALRNGPLAVIGAVELAGAAFLDGATHDRFTLCRCGASRKMPFCDGSHNEVGFSDE
jgi:CDGSH-type Zn-finger protein